MKQIIRFALLSSLLPILLFGQKKPEVSFHRIEESLMNQMSVYPQEKIHLHTDRDFYVSGEKIWFKAYITDAATHQFPTYSRYVYVELIDMRDSLVHRVMIRPIDDMFYGHIFLSEIIPEGNYTLRAYTRNMENLGDDYFFKKNIRIGNISFDEKQSAKGKQVNKNVNPVKDDFEVSFFPEGGNLPEGIPCRVAFKALNQTGLPASISGRITDETGTEIASINTLHAGMGMFSYVPVLGKKYLLKCRNENGLEKQFELPQPDTRAYSLMALRKDKKLLIGIQKSIHSPDIPCYLLVHCRGLALYFSAWDTKKEYATFSEEHLPAGVIQFILFDENMNPLSERLVFNKNKEDVEVEFHTDKTVYDPRENVISNLSLTDSGGNPLTGHFSVAITDDNDIAVDSSTTILSTLLLSSELKGYIENPAWYLRNDVESVTALDYLMMTHGWRRYNIPEAVKGNMEYPAIPFQLSQEISGKVKSLILSKPVADSEILMRVQDGDFGMAVTDDNGKFIFRDFEYPDSASYFIQALSKKGSNRVELVLNSESFPPLIYAPQSPVAEIKEEAKDIFIAKAEQRSKFDDNMRVVNLSEVVVTAPRIERKDEPRLQYPLNKGSDKTIRREEFEKSPPLNVTRLLQRYGVLQKIVINKTLILIDGITASWSESMIIKTEYDYPWEQVTIQDIESIDIFKNTSSSAAIFGFRGYDGVISITTRRGISKNEREEFNYKFNYTTYTPLGYQKPVEFYSPRYETIEAKRQSVPDYRTTIFWKPDVVVSNEGKASFDFYAADFPANYSVVIEGLTEDGRIIRQVEKIQVK